MRSLVAFSAALLLLASCGRSLSDLPDGVAGSYVFGDAVKARKKATEPEPGNPLAGLTTKDLLDRMEAGEEFVLSASVSMLLVLDADGTFDYYGPLKMGDDEAHVQGHWDGGEGVVRLRLDTPRPSGDETVSVLVCPYREGVIEYPLGGDPKNQVYYRLLDVERLHELGAGEGGVRIDMER